MIVIIINESFILKNKIRNQIKIYISGTILNI